MVSELSRLFFFICLFSICGLTLFIKIYTDTEPLLAKIKLFVNPVIEVNINNNLDDGYIDDDGYDDYKPANEEAAVIDSHVTSSNPNLDEDYDYRINLIHDETLMVSNVPNIILLEDVDQASVRPMPDKSARQIFFLETSHPEGANLELKERQACAIESAAIMHPNHNIYVLIIGNTTVDLNSVTSRTYKNLIENYSNVFFRRVDPRDFMLGTPIEKFKRWKILRNSKNYNVYLADILRLVVLWKYGGLYFDTDIVVLKNFEDLGENYLCIASNKLLMSGTMQFSSTGIGHEVVEQLLKNVINEFKPRSWASNGPVLVMRVMKRICNATNTASMNEKNCKGIKILPRPTFLPVKYTEHMFYFNPKFKDAVMMRVSNAYTAHIYNHMNHHIRLNTTSKAGYILLANKYCPIIYKNLGEYF